MWMRGRGAWRLGSGLVAERRGASAFSVAKEVPAGFNGRRSLAVCSDSECAVPSSR